jgi:Na+-translocating ferredoxin:NAD+ oxidoreductase RNF subunit RnfB
MLEAIKAVLPGINCGRCGFAGCEGAAKALMAGKAGIHVCITAGPDVAPRLAKILGKTCQFKEPGIAESGCIGAGCLGSDRAVRRYYYMGLGDCRAQALLYGGSLVCPTGCLGQGTCIRACPFHVLDKAENGMPQVTPDRCRGCGICSDICPKGVLSVVGKISIADLMDNGFKAVFLGLGAWIVPPLCVRGESAHGVTGSLDFLSRAGSDISTLNGVRVAVIGESNTAMDCARTCVRLQADRVTLLCPCDDRHMSARKRDVERAVEEGVKIHFLAIPSRVCSDLADQVTAIEFHSMTPAACPSGVPILSDLDKDLPGGVKAIEVQLVIAAYEREPDLDYLLYDTKVECRFRASPRGTLAVDPDTLMASHPNVFAAGDLYTGRSTVINAIADGRRAARSIHLQLTSGEVSMPKDLRRKLNKDSIIKEVHLARDLPRVMVSEIEPKIRIQSLFQDIVGGITDSQAQEEVVRCLQCGTTCYDK